MKKTLMFCLCIYAMSASAFEDFDACEECNAAAPRVASDESMARIAQAWAQTANGSAVRLGACVDDRQVAVADAMLEIERWSTILFKLRHYLDHDVTRAACYSEVFENYVAGKKGLGTASNCQDFQGQFAFGS